MNSQNISEISYKWSFKDYLSAFKVRMSIGRNNYRVNPGLYKIGNPYDNSEVFVSANYKLSFDVLRRSLHGIDGWILVLDTKGINVWCAAGKGTFGTWEIINQINQTNLTSFVSHKRLIVPQLGASGIAAHAIKDITGFNVQYGPVRASDIKEYLDNGKKATEDMRHVHFNFMDRLIVAPVEIMNSLWKISLIIVTFVLLSGISSSGYSFQNVLNKWSITAIIIGISYITGTFLTPILLPYLPFRQFAGKGMALQSIIFIIIVLTGALGNNILFLISWFLMTIGLSSYLAMNFTGASTYTSLSGVIKEMRLFIPLQIIAVSSGFILLIISKFIKLWMTRFI